MNNKKLYRKTYNKRETEQRVAKQRYIEHMYKTLVKQAEHFGIENRLIQCLEETGELQQAICKCIRTQKEDSTCAVSKEQAIEMLEEEIADTEICIEQIKHLLSLNKTKIEAIKQVKLKRTQERMEEHGRT